MKERIIKELKKPLFWVGVLFIIYIVYKGCNETNQRDAYSVGTIVEYTNCAIGEACIDFEFEINGIKYFGKGAKGEGFKDCEKTGWCLGKKFKVKYSTKNPENSILLLDEPVD